MEQAGWTKNEPTANRRRSARRKRTKKRVERRATKQASLDFGILRPRRASLKQGEGVGTYGVGRRVVNGVEGDARKGVDWGREQKVSE
ncbi:hypothetical protein QLX08_010064 [Tetragonisca angustula]|uniref:Uncharacterized protein n=1 Tax=Tetragonisca angustula TaxID=166442 RepID=A0AAW0ZE54_9HYME